jgi:sialidase-1
MQLNRRSALQKLSAGAVMAGIVAEQDGVTEADEPPETNKPTAPDSPTGLIDVPTVISRPSDRYYGWPTLTRCTDGRLLVVTSGGRQQHVCPFGRVDLIQSNDDGQTWTFARTICDGPIDDRDAGIIETSQGTLLVTTFTSLAYVPALEKANAAAASGKPIWNADQLADWNGVHNRLAAGHHDQHLGTWMLRSEDRGITWSAPYRVPVNSPHGPTSLSDGNLVYAGKALWDGTDRVGVCHSEDDGRTWTWLSDIPTRDGDLLSNYHELHAVETDEGRIIVQIRNHNPMHNHETLQCESTDGGRTWSTPHSIGVWGLPSHLLKLGDGRLLMTYGHRRAPLGIQARISTDQGESWSETMILYGDGTSGDLGYPSSIEFPDGRLLTVWYEKLSGQAGAQLLAGTWTLPDA